MSCRMLHWAQVHACDMTRSYCQHSNYCFLSGKCSFYSFIETFIEDKIPLFLRNGHQVSLCYYPALPPFDLLDLRVSHQVRMFPVATDTTCSGRSGGVGERRSVWLEAGRTIKARVCPPSSTRRGGWTGGDWRTRDLNNGQEMEIQSDWEATCAELRFLVVPECLSCMWLKSVFSTFVRRSASTERDCDVPLTTKETNTITWKHGMSQNKISRIHWIVLGINRDGGILWKDTYSDGYSFFIHTLKAFSQSWLPVAGIKLLR